MTGAQPAGASASTRTHVSEYAPSHDAELYVCGPRLLHGTLNSRTYASHGTPPAVAGSRMSRSMSTKPPAALNESHCAEHAPSSAAYHSETEQSAGAAQPASKFPHTASIIARLTEQTPEP